MQINPPMARVKKKLSEIIRTAAKRSAGLASINQALDLGNGLTLAFYQSALAETQAKLAAYNKLLSDADEAIVAFEAAEKQLQDLNTRVLAGVAAHFGRESSEYKQAGGKRTSERKRPVRRPASAPALAA